MAVPYRSDDVPPNLARFLERAKQETEEARRVIGRDPQEAFAEFARAHYDYESARDLLREMTEEGPAWRDDDVNDGSDD